MSFPLYDSLTRDLPKKDLSVAKKEEFIEKVKKIDQNGRELVYALIQFFNIKNCEEERSDDLPYGGSREEASKVKDNLSWSLTDFPIKLRHILYKFVNMHIQNMEEQSKRPKIP